MVQRIEPGKDGCETRILSLCCAPDEEETKLINEIEQSQFLYTLQDFCSRYCVYLFFYEVIEMASYVGYGPDSTTPGPTTTCRPSTPMELRWRRLTSSLSCFRTTATATGSATTRAGADHQDFHS